MVIEHHGLIIAIGGGGFTNAVDPDLDAFVLARCPPDRLRVGLVGIASGDDATKLSRFYAWLAGTGIRASHYETVWTRAESRNWLLDQGLIYVGGGNTARLITDCRDRGLDEDFADASRRGAVLAGVSAGGACWFEAMLSDSRGTGLAPLAGLGLLAGSCCPHYSSEPARRPAFEAAIATAALPEGIAVDDGAAVLVEAGRPPRAISVRPGAWAYRVASAGPAGNVISEPLVTYAN